MQKTRAKTNEIKSWFFEKINKIAKPLVRFIKKKEGEDSIKIRNKKEVTTDTAKIQRIIRDYLKQVFFSIKWANQKKWTNQKSTAFQD